MKALRVLAVALAAIFCIGLSLGYATNFTATQGSGTTFASAVISATNYVEILLCDATVGATQCAAVNSSGQVAIQAPPSLPLPAGAATAANQTNGAQVAQVNNSLSIGNITGTVTLPTGAATSANQTNASQKSQIVDGSGNVIGSTSNALNVNCTGCSAATTVTATQGGVISPYAVNITGLAGTALGSPVAYGSTPSGNAIGVNAFVTNVNSNGQNTPANSSPVVLPVSQTVADPCMFQLKTSTPISTSSGTIQVVSGLSGKKVYICSMILVVSPSASVSLAEGSNSSCGSSQAAVMGVATNGTAANGVPLTTNGGWTYGNGGGTVAQTATAGNSLCLFQSGTSLEAGQLGYIQQ